MYSFERNACVIPSAQTHDVNKKTQQTATWTQAHLNCRWWGKQSRRADTPWNACRCDDAVRVCNGTWLDRATPNCYSPDQRQSTTTPHTRAHPRSPLTRRRISFWRAPHTCGPNLYLWSSPPTTRDSFPPFDRLHSTKYISRNYDQVKFQLTIKIIILRQGQGFLFILCSLAY